MLGGQVNDVFRVGASLGATVDGGQDDPVAMVVQERCRERQATAHVVEGVVTHDEEFLHREPTDGGLLLLGLHDRVDTGFHRIHPTHRTSDGTQDVPVALLTAQDHVFLPDAPEPQGESEHDKEGQQRDPADDGKRKGELVQGELGHGAPSYTRAMRPEEVKVLLRGIEEGTTSVDQAFQALSALPVEDIDLAQLDTHRELRQGMPEAIFAEGKTPEQVSTIASVLLEKNTGSVLATRVSPEMVDSIKAIFPDAVHHAEARLLVFRTAPKRTAGSVAVVSAGTSDLPVAEEAAIVAETCGAEVIRVTDVGVAGLHRLLRSQDRLRSADVVIVIAGMEGALASLVGGITAAPVVAVPTSVGYGSSFDGLAALLAMLNSCAAGVAVMNIDNGFGAAMFALRLLQVIDR